MAEKENQFNEFLNLLDPPSDPIPPDEDSEQEAIAEFRGTLDPNPGPKPTLSQTIDGQETVADGMSPITALPESPLGVGERAFIAAAELSTEEGRKTAQAQLRGRFKDMQFNDEMGLVVLDSDNKWKQIDPNIWKGQQDIFSSETLVDLTEGTVDLIPAILGGVAAGAAALGTSGAGLAGAGAIAAGVAVPTRAVMKTVLGSVIGVEDRTNEELASDLAFEGVLNLVAPFAGAAFKAAASFGLRKTAAVAQKSGLTEASKTALNLAKPTFKNVADGFNNAAKAMGSSSKEAMTNFLSFTSGGTKQQVGSLFDPTKSKVVTDKMFPWMALGKKSGEKLSTGIQSLESQKVASMREALRRYPVQRSRTYGQLKDKVLNESGIDGFRWAPQRGNDIFVSTLQNLGMVTKNVDTKQVAAASKEQLGKLLGDVPAIEIGAVNRSLVKIVDTMNRLGRRPLMQGKEGAKSALEYKQAINDIRGLVIGSSPQSQLANREASMALGEVQESIAKAFGAPGSSARIKYNAMDQFYVNTAEFASQASRLTKTAAKRGDDDVIKNGINSFYKKATDDTAENLFEKQMYSTMKSMKPLQKLMRNAEISDSAAFGLRWMPIGVTGKGPISKSDIARGGIAVAGNILSAPAFSPRALAAGGAALGGARRGIQGVAPKVAKNLKNASYQFADMTLGLTEGAKQQLVNNPVLLSRIFEQVAASSQEPSQQEIEQLLRQQGVIQ